MEVKTGDLIQMSYDDFAKLVKDDVEAYAKAIKRPSADWERLIFKDKIAIRYGDGKYTEILDAMPGRGKCYSIILVNKKEKINIIFRIQAKDKKFLDDTKNQIKKIEDAGNAHDRLYEMSNTLVTVSGSTEFTENVDSDKWLTFDRRGISDSFYIAEFSKYETPADVARCIRDQIQRVADSRYRAANTLSLPGPLARWKRTKGEIDQLRDQLKDRGKFSLHTYGMGTGYTISVEPVDSRQSKVASKEISDFFGFRKLYITPFDAD